MRESLVPLLRCPVCRAEGAFALEGPVQRDAREVRTATLRCAACGATAPIRDGIVELLHDPPDFVRREAAGLERFAAKMRQDGWDDTMIRALPYVDDGYWYVQATSFVQLCREVPFEPGRRLLDVGANTCWASSRFAELGLDVVALDISAGDLQGLRTADRFFAADRRHFERVLGPMFDLPFAADTFDDVFACEVLHHNDAANLRRTFAECFRVLRPGGRLLVINEALKAIANRMTDHAVDVAEYEGYEHAFFLHEYWAAARRAGFRVSVMTPVYLPFFRGDPLFGTTPWSRVRAAVLRRARGSRLGRAVYLAYRLGFRGDVGLNLVCRKPDASRGWARAADTNGRDARSRLIGVSMNPGAMSITSMPSGRTSPRTPSR